MSVFKFLSLNVRGLRNREKMKINICILESQKAKLTFIFFKKRFQTLVMRRFGRRNGVVKFSIHMNPIQGRNILIKPNSTLHADIVELDTNGRFIILRLKTQGENSLNMVNVYASTDNHEQSEFLDSFSKKIISLTDTSNLVMAGDWYTTLSPLDKQGGLTWKETEYRNSLIHFIKEIKLVDIYREMHPKNKFYTYESKPLKLKSCIDCFLISSKYKPDISKVETRISIAPDHKAVFLSMNVNEESKRGPGLWKFNNTLFQDDVIFNRTIAR